MSQALRHLTGLTAILQFSVALLPVAQAQTIVVAEVESFLSNHALTLVPDYEMPVDPLALREAHLRGERAIVTFRADGSILGRDEDGEMIFLPGPWLVIRDGGDTFLSVQGEEERPRIVALDSDRVVMTLPGEGTMYFYAVDAVDHDAEANWAGRLEGDWTVRAISGQSLQHMQPTTYKLLPGGLLEIDVDEAAPGDPVDTEALLPVGRWTSSATPLRVEIGGEVFEGPLLILYDTEQGGIPFVVYELRDDHMAIRIASPYAPPVRMKLER